MKVTLESVLEGKNTLAVSAEVDTFADLAKLARKLLAHVAGVRKLMPDMANAKVEKVRVVTE
jgi:hypothetical protein